MAEDLEVEEFVEDNTQTDSPCPECPDGSSPGRDPDGNCLPCAPEGTVVTKDERGQEVSVKNQAVADEIEGKKALARLDKAEGKKPENQAQEGLDELNTIVDNVVSKVGDDADYELNDWETNLIELSTMQDEEGSTVVLDNGERVYNPLNEINQTKLKQVVSQASNGVRIPASPENLGLLETYGYTFIEVTPELRHAGVTYEYILELGNINNSPNVVKKIPIDKSSSSADQEKPLTPEGVQPSELRQQSESFQEDIQSQLPQPSEEEVTANLDVLASTMQTTENEKWFMIQNNVGVINDYRQEEGNEAIIIDPDGNIIGTAGVPLGNTQTPQRMPENVLEEITELLISGPDAIQPSRQTLYYLGLVQFEDDRWMNQEEKEAEEEMLTSQTGFTETPQEGLNNLMIETLNQPRFEGVLRYVIDNDAQVTRRDNLYNIMGVDEKGELTKSRIDGTTPMFNGKPFDPAKGTPLQQAAYIQQKQTLDGIQKSFLPVTWDLEYAADMKYKMAHASSVEEFEDLQSEWKSYIQKQDVDGVEEDTEMLYNPQTGNLFRRDEIDPEDITKYNLIPLEQFVQSEFRFTDEDQLLENIMDQSFDLIAAAKLMSESDNFGFQATAWNRDLIGIINKIADQGSLDGLKTDKRSPFIGKLKKFHFPDSPIEHQWNNLINKLTVTSRAYLMNFDPLTLERDGTADGFTDRAAEWLGVDNVSPDEEKTVWANHFQEDFPELWNSMTQVERDAFYESSAWRSFGQGSFDFAIIAAEFLLTRKLVGGTLTRILYGDAKYGFTGLRGIAAQAKTGSSYNALAIKVGAGNGGKATKSMIDWSMYYAEEVGIVAANDVIWQEEMNPFYFPIGIATMRTVLNRAPAGFLSKLDDPKWVKANPAKATQLKKIHNVLKVTGFPATLEEAAVQAKAIVTGAGTLKTGGFFEGLGHAIENPDDSGLIAEAFLNFVDPKDWANTMGFLVANRLLLPDKANRAMFNKFKLDARRLLDVDRRSFASTLGGSRKSFYDPKTPLGTRTRNIDNAASKAKKSRGLNIGDESNSDRIYESIKNDFKQLGISISEIKGKSLQEIGELMRSKANEKNNGEGVSNPDVAAMTKIYDFLQGGGVTVESLVNHHEISTAQNFSHAVNETQAAMHLYDKSNAAGAYDPDDFAKTAVGQKQGWVPNSRELQFIGNTSNNALKVMLNEAGWTETQISQWLGKWTAVAENIQAATFRYGFKAGSPEQQQYIRNEQKYTNLVDILAVAKEEFKNNPNSVNTLNLETAQSKVDAQLKKQIDLITEQKKRTKEQGEEFLNKAQEEGTEVYETTAELMARIDELAANDPAMAPELMRLKRKVEYEKQFTVEDNQKLDDLDYEIEQADLAGDLDLLKDLQAQKQLIIDNAADVGSKGFSLPNGVSIVNKEYIGNELKTMMNARIGDWATGQHENVHHWVNDIMRQKGWKTAEGKWVRGGQIKAREFVKKFKNLLTEPQRKIILQRLSKDGSYQRDPQGSIEWLNYYAEALLNGELDYGYNDIKQMADLIGSELKAGAKQMGMSDAEFELSPEGMMNFLLGYAADTRKGGMSYRNKVMAVMAGKKVDLSDKDVKEVEATVEDLEGKVIEWSEELKEFEAKKKELIKEKSKASYQYMAGDMTKEDYQDRIDGLNLKIKLAKDMISNVSDKDSSLEIRIRNAKNMEIIKDLSIPQFDSRRVRADNQLFEDNQGILQEERAKYNPNLGEGITRSDWNAQIYSYYTDAVKSYTPSKGAFSTYLKSTLNHKLGNYIDKNLDKLTKDSGEYHKKRPDQQVSSGGDEMTNAWDITMQQIDKGYLTEGSPDVTIDYDIGGNKGSVSKGNNRDYSLSGADANKILSEEFNMNTNEMIGMINEALGKLGLENFTMKGLHTEKITLEDGTEMPLGRALEMSIREQFGPEIHTAKDGGLKWGAKEKEHWKTFLNEHWETIYQLLPENLTSESFTTRGGQSTGVRNVLLNEFYTQKDRVGAGQGFSDKGVGSKWQEKNPVDFKSNIDKENFIAFVMGGKNRLEAILNEMAKTTGNQLARQTKDAATQQKILQQGIDNPEYEKYTEEQFLNNVEAQLRSGMSKMADSEGRILFSEEMQQKGYDEVAEAVLVFNDYNQKHKPVKGKNFFEYYRDWKEGDRENIPDSMLADIMQVDMDILQKIQTKAGSKRFGQKFTDFVSEEDNIQKVGANFNRNATEVKSMLKRLEKQKASFYTVKGDDKIWDKDALAKFDKTHQEFFEFVMTSFPELNKFTQKTGNRYDITKGKEMLTQMFGIGSRTTGGKDIDISHKWFKPENFKEALDNPNISQEAKDYFNAIDWSQITANNIGAFNKIKSILQGTYYSTEKGGGLKTKPSADRQEKIDAIAKELKPEAQQALGNLYNFWATMKNDFVASKNNGGKGDIAGLEDALSFVKHLEQFNSNLVYGPRAMYNTKYFYVTEGYQDFTVDNPIYKQRYDDVLYEYRDRDPSEPITIGKKTYDNLFKYAEYAAKEWAKFKGEHVYDSSNQSYQGYVDILTGNTAEALRTKDWDLMVQVMSPKRNLDRIDNLYGSTSPYNYTRFVSENKSILENYIDPMTGETLLETVRMKAGKRVDEILNRDVDINKLLENPAFKDKFDVVAVTDAFNKYDATSVALVETLLNAIRDPKAAEASTEAANTQATERLNDMGVDVEITGLSETEANHVTQMSEEFQNHEGTVDRKLGVPTKEVKAEVGVMDSVMEEVTAEMADFDDVTGSSETIIKYTTKDGVVHEITQDVFNAKKLEIESADDFVEGSWDYEGFNSMDSAVEGPDFQYQLDTWNRLVKEGRPEDYFLITARGPKGRENYVQWMNDHGFEGFTLDNLITTEGTLIEGAGDHVWDNKKVIMGLLPLVSGQRGKFYNKINISEDYQPTIEAFEVALESLGLAGEQRLIIEESSELFGLEDKTNAIDILLEESFGIDRIKEYSAVRAHQIGEKSGKRTGLLGPQYQDMEGMYYGIISPGKQGEAQLKYLNENHLDVYIDNQMKHEGETIRMGKEYNVLREENNTILKDKNKVLKLDGVGTEYTLEDVIRIGAWQAVGTEINGIAKSDLTAINNYLSEHPEIAAFSQRLVGISKLGTYEGMTNDASWKAGSIEGDLYSTLRGSVRDNVFQPFYIADALLFSERNENKIRVARGNAFGDEFNTLRQTMRDGTNRLGQGNIQDQKYLNYFTQWQQAVMSVNFRSMAMQTTSLTNFINVSDNNIFAAGKAFANQPRYWSDVSEIWNSDWAKSRRGGGNEIASAEIIELLRTSKGNKMQTFLNYMLEKGYKPAQMGDIAAIVFGGAPLLHNRTQTYIKKGMSYEDARAKAMKDVYKKVQRNQQSRLPGFLGNWQKSMRGRIFGGFHTTQFAYAREIDKALRDIKNKRGSLKENISKVLNYGVLQPAAFAAGQGGLFMLLANGYSEEEAKEMMLQTGRTAGGNVMQGFGMPGIILDVSLQAGEELYKQYQKEGTWPGPDYSKALMKFLNLSPAVGGKLKQFLGAGNAIKYQTSVTRNGKKYTIDYKVYDPNNPKFEAATKSLQAIFNIPAENFRKLYANAWAIGLKTMDPAAWDSGDILKVTALMLGWPEWQVTSQADKDAKQAAEKKQILEENSEQIMEDRFNKDNWGDKNDKDPFDKADNW